MLAHFLEPAVGVSVGAWVVLRSRALGPARVCLLIAIVQLGGLITTHCQNPSVIDVSTSWRLKVVFANVLTENPDTERLRRFLIEERPDIVGLAEVDTYWLSELAELAQTYPWRLEAPGGADGLALWLKNNPDAARTRGLFEPTSIGFPAIQALVRHDGHDLNLWLLHPSSPIRRTGKGPGNPELDTLRGAIAERADRESTIVIGDLNTTDRSPEFSDLLRATRLRDSRVGFGSQPSWPCWSPYRLAIDHALVSDDLVVLERRLGPDVGSDHRPVVLVVGIGTRPVRQAD
jgi:endonuclease/exonuclease/phosphatase (EEP) superfamily protein YafD